MQKLLLIIAIINTLIVAYIGKLMTNLQIAYAKQLPLFDVLGGKFMANMIWWVSVGALISLVLAMYCYFAAKRK